VPTTQAIRIADRILRLLHQGLECRNPRLPQVQRWINSTQQWLDRRIDDLPWNPTQAQGMLLEGITGIGKSHVVERVLYFIPQVVDHEPQGDWGMLRLRQLVWLKVHMPADHTRRGLLVSMLTEMDKVLGTDYVERLVRPSVSIEVLMVKVMHQLAQHRCGMLIIEEAQDQNMGSKTFSRDFLNFFLRILNWGVPVLLMGNPLAFNILKKHAQDADRFSEGGWFTLLPEVGPESDIWKRLWIPGLWSPCLLDQADAEFSPVEACPAAHDWASFLWQLTGGLPRQLAHLRTEVMDCSLINKKERVTSEWVMWVFDHSPIFSVVRARNKALANHDLKALMDYEDLPLDLLRQHWRNTAQMPAICSAQPQSESMTHERHSAPAINQDTQVRELDVKEQDRLCDGIKAATQKAKAQRQTRGKSDTRNMHDDD